ncbi:MAG TPA: molybdopterin dinucleotide binding domain-containing protein, partial [Rectinemataceae bacterium]|nr:molybdopterin dinucleotide binding domain-containing protein [Rectinemataceae bacterium]
PYEGQERSDYEIFQELASKFGVENKFSEGRNESQWIDYFLHFSEIADVGDFKAKGIYLGKEQKRSGLSAFAAAPEAYPLRTQSGKLELGGQRWATKAADGRFPFLLVTPKVAYRVHSQGGDHPEEIRRNLLSINCSDANALGLRDGDEVKIVSGIGATRVKVETSDQIMKGVVSLPEGTWYENQDGAEDHSGSANILTSTMGTEESTSCVMHGIPVRLEPCRVPNQG